MTSQATFRTSSGGLVSADVAMSLDANSVPQAISASNPLPVSVVSGGVGSGGLSDTILTDDSGTQFLARDNGTAITYITLSGSAYTPSTNIRGVSISGGATSALQTTGNTSLASIDSKTPALQSGQVPVLMTDAYQNPVTATWTSATALNTTQTLSTAGYDTVVMTIAPSGTITAGAITFEVYDGYNWITIKAPRTDSYQTDTIFSLAGATLHSWQISAAGYPQVRARLSTQIAGTGNISIVSIVSSAPDVSMVTAGFDPSSPLPPGTNVIGSVTKQGSVSDGSGTIASANTSQQAMAANSNRRYFFFQNIGTANIYLNFGSAATVGAGSMQIPPGASITMDSGFVSTDAIYVISATPSVPYTCKQG